MHSVVNRTVHLLALAIEGTLEGYITALHSLDETEVPSHTPGPSLDWVTHL